MQKENLGLYSKEEQKLIEKLDELFYDWKQTLEKYYNEHGKEKWLDAVYEDAWFVPDGFYPQYLAQQTKILFIGRESYTLTGANYIDLFIYHYLNGKTGSDNNLQSINCNKFHKLLLEISYGIIHNKEWNEIPYASEICEKQGVFNKTNFAFMNVSKFSNENVDTGNTNTDWNLVTQSLLMSVSSERNFILEEIKLLNPDLIITMNFGEDLLKLVFGNTISTCLEETGLIYHVNINGGKVMLANPYHFSSRVIPESDMYTSIFEAWKNFAIEK